MKLFLNPSGISAIFFDCFGTLFDMSQIPREQIAAYVEHVNRSDFTEYKFPREWYDLKAFPDVKEGLNRLRERFVLGTLSNGSYPLLLHLADANGLKFEEIINMAKHRIYKPNFGAYYLPSVATGTRPSEIMMVTANPTFGDVEGALHAGMSVCVIRDTETPLHPAVGRCKDLLEMATRFGV